MQTTHTHIIRAYFAYTRMSIRAHTHVYVSLLCIPISFFVWSIVGQTKDLLFLWEWKRLQSEICILLKPHADQWKLSYFEFSITSQIHRQTCSILIYKKWEENWNSHLKSLFQHVNFMFLQGKFCVSARVGKSFAKCLLSEFCVL